MPFGSSARLSARITASSTGSARRGELRRFQPSDAMLGADAAAETLDQIEHGRLERRAAREKRRVSAHPAAGSR